MVDNVELKCGNKKCGYKWDYKGKGTFYASCPKCRWNIKLSAKEKPKAKAKKEV
jgi:hypothetical protein